MRALLIATFTLAAACRRDEYCSPAGTGVRCNGPATGTATVSAPARYGTPRSVRAAGGTCLGQDGTCSARPPIIVSAAFVAGWDSLGILLTLPAREGPATYVVSSSSSDVVFDQASFDVDLNGSDFVPLTPLSGAIVVELLTTDAFRATFDMELETPDHQLISITGGRVENAGCETFAYPAECHPFD